MATQKEKPYMKPADAKEYGIGQAAWYSLLRSGKVKSIKIGRRYVVPRESFLNWYRSCGGQLEAGQRVA